MAIEVGATASAEATSTNTVLASITVDLKPGAFLVAWVSAVDTGGTTPPTVSSVVFNGSENLTERWTTTTTYGRCSMYALASPSATTANVTVTLSASELELGLIVAVYYGVNLTTPLGTASTATGTTANPIWVSCAGPGVNGGLSIAYVFRTLSSVVAHTVADQDGIPEFIASGALSTATAQTSRTPAAPANRQVGDIELAHCASENNATHSVSGSGWVKLGQTNSGASWTVSHYYRIYDGSNVDPVISWTGSADASARRHAFRDGGVATDLPAYLGTVGTGTGATHTSTGGNTSADDSLAVYIDHATANTALATPSGWSEHKDSGSATGPCRTTMGSKEVATGGSGSGNISVTGAAAAWVQQQIEIKNHENGDQVLIAERESAWTNEGSIAAAYEQGAAFNQFGWLFSAGTGAAYLAGAVALNAASSQTTLALPHIASGATLYGLTVSSQTTLSLPHIASGATLYGLVVGLDGDLTFALPHIASTAALYGVLVANDASASAPALPAGGGGGGALRRRGSKRAYDEEVQADIDAALRALRGLPDTEIGRALEAQTNTLIAPFAPTFDGAALAPDAPVNWRGFSASQKRRRALARLAASALRERAAFEALLAQIAADEADDEDVLLLAAAA